MLQRPLMETSPTRASVAVLVDGGSLALAAAAVIVDEARRAVKERGRFTIALAGGSTPKVTFGLLAAPPLAELIPWQQTHVFWGDERCVDISDQRSNERTAREALLDHVPVPAEQIHPMRCSGPGAHGEAAARRAADKYEVLLRTLFPVPADRGCGGSATSREPTIDFVMLGMGGNGHTASLFPGSRTLDERDRWAVADLEDPGTAEATSSTGERLWRVSLTAPFINRARLVLFVVSGAGKAAAVRDVVGGEGDPHELPALLIRPEPGRLAWLLDEAAAAQLPHGGSPAAGSWPGGIESYADLPGCTTGPSR